MAKQMYSAFDPMDPLDLCIMTDPNYDKAVGYSEDGEDVDLPYDPAAEDAEDYSAAEMELLSGDFGNNTAIDSIDGIEFTGMD